jgi:hypothetical protein
MMEKPACQLLLLLRIPLPNYIIPFTGIID